MMASRKNGRERPKTPAASRGGNARTDGRVPSGPARRPTLRGMHENPARACELEMDRRRTGLWLEADARPGGWLPRKGDAGEGLRNWWMRKNHPSRRILGFGVWFISDPAADRDRAVRQPFNANGQLKRGAASSSQDQRQIWTANTHFLRKIAPAGGNHLYVCCELRHAKCFLWKLTHVSKMLQIETNVSARLSHHPVCGPKILT